MKWYLKNWVTQTTITPYFEISVAIWWSYMMTFHPYKNYFLKGSINFHSSNGIHRTKSVRRWTVYDYAHKLIVSQLLKFCLGLKGPQSNFNQLEESADNLVSIRCHFNHRTKWDVRLVGKEVYKTYQPSLCCTPLKVSHELILDKMASAPFQGTSPVYRDHLEYFLIEPTLQGSFSWMTVPWGALSLSLAPVLPAPLSPSSHVASNSHGYPRSGTRDAPLQGEAAELRTAKTGRSPKPGHRPSFPAHPLNEPFSRLPMKTWQTHGWQPATHERNQWTHHDDTRY